MSDMHVYRFSLIQIGFSWSNALMQSNFKCSQWRRSGVFETLNIFHTSFYSVFIVNFGHYVTPFCSVSIVGFEQVNVSWEVTVEEIKQFFALMLLTSVLMD